MNLLTSTSRRALGAFSFARLNGLAGGAKRAEDDKPKDDEKDKDARRAEDKDPEHYDDDGKGKHAEGKDDDGDEEKEKDGKDAARRSEKDDEDENEARRAEDDDDDEEMKKAKAAGFGPLLAAQRQAGRLAERARIGRILSSAAAASRIGTAAHIACNTGMSSSAAIALLETVPSGKAAGGALDRAMSRVPQPQPGGDGGGQAKQTPGASLLATAKAHAAEIEEKKKARR